ncbi:hypothetical protein M0805_003677 [Coniferiporia weirii]|nr:hypothetical protein M0805_003677 [Coniferiporia weirii]
MANDKSCSSTFAKTELALGILIGFLFLYFFSLLLQMFAIDSEQHRNHLRFLCGALKPDRENLQGSVGGERSEPGSTTTVKEPLQWDDAMRALCKAMVRCDVDFVSRTLKAAPSLANKSNQARYSLLHAAVLSGNVDVVRFALEQPGIDVSSADKSDLGIAVELNVQEADLGIRSASTKGATPLHYACMIGNIEIATLLLEHGAAFDACDNEGREPVAYFDVHNHSEALATYQEIIKDRQEWYDRLYGTSLMSTC